MYEKNGLSANASSSRKWWKKKIFQVYFPLVWYLVINTIHNQKWLQLYVSYDDLDIFFLINIEGETRRKVHQGIDNWKKWFI